MKFIVYDLVPILLILYLIIEIMVPAFIFPSRPFFWWTKSLRGKNVKTSFEEEVQQAESAMREAEKKLEHLLDSATEETSESEKRKKQAQDAFEKAKERLEKLKNK